jgi:hypothetical protein
MWRDRSVFGCKRGDNWSHCWQSKYEHKLQIREKRLLRTGVVWRIILKWILKKCDWMTNTGFLLLTIETAICEHGSGSSCTVKCEEILDLLRKCDVFKKDCDLFSEWLRTVIQESLVVWTPLLSHSLALYFLSCTIMISSFFLFISFFRSFFIGCHAVHRKCRIRCVYEHKRGGNRWLEILSRNWKLQT